jgi:hypothetical protein
MNHDGASGWEDPTPGLSDPASLWPLVNALTAILGEDCDQHARAVVGDASQELAMTRALLAERGLTVTPTGAPEDDNRIGIERVMHQFRCDIDRWESEIVRYQEEIAQLATQLVHPDERPVLELAPPRPLQVGGPRHAVMDGHDTVRGSEWARADGALAVKGFPVDTEPIDTRSDQAESSATAAANTRDQRNKWKANAIVGAITVMAVVLVLLILGTL